MYRECIASIIVFFTKLYVIDKDNLVEICKNGEQSWRHAVATSHEPEK